MGDPVRVAVVEDDADLRELHRLRLSDDYDVTTVPTGTAALERIDDQDILLLDRDLPGPDGETVARRLRTTGYQGAIAMVTGERPDPAMASVPIDDYVTKPIDGNETRSLVARLETRLEMPNPIRDLFGKVSRRGHLEAVHSRSKLVEVEPYRSLTRRIERQYRNLTDGRYPPERIAVLAEETLAPGIDAPGTIVRIADDPRQAEVGVGPGQEF